MASSDNRVSFTAHWTWTCRCAVWEFVKHNDCLKQILLITESDLSGFVLYFTVKLDLKKRLSNKRRVKNKVSVYHPLSILFQWIAALLLMLYKGLIPITTFPIVWQNQHLLHHFESWQVCNIKTLTWTNHDKTHPLHAHMGAPPQRG